MSFCVGLTGGIASGKTSAAKRFEELGAAVVDTDAIAHELTRPATAAMAQIGRAFGPAFVAPDGSLERAKMRQLVFRDSQARVKLEAILHPLIREQARARAAGRYYGIGLAVAIDPSVSNMGYVATALDPAPDHAAVEVDHPLEVPDAQDEVVDLADPDHRGTCLPSI